MCYFFFSQLGVFVCFFCLNCFFSSQFHKGYLYCEIFSLNVVFPEKSPYLPYVKQALSGSLSPVNTDVSKLWGRWQVFYYGFCFFSWQKILEKCRELYCQSTKRLMHTKMICEVCSLLLIVTSDHCPLFSKIPTLLRHGPSTYAAQPYPCLL